MIHTRTKIGALISLVFFVGALIAYVLFSRVVMNHKESLENERIRAVEAETKRKALSTLEVMLASSKESREELATFVLKDENIIEFLTLIEQTARDQGVTLATDSLTVNPLNDMFEELYVTVKVEGSFDGVMRTLRILETLPIQSSLSRAVLNKAEKDGVAWTAAFDLRVTKFKKYEN